MGLQLNSQGLHELHYKSFNSKNGSVRTSTLQNDIRNVHEAIVWSFGGAKWLLEFKTRVSWLFFSQHTRNMLSELVVILLPRQKQWPASHAPDRHGLRSPFDESMLCLIAN